MKGRDNFEIIFKSRLGRDLPAITGSSESDPRLLLFPALRAPPVKSHAEERFAGSLSMRLSVDRCGEVEEEEEEEEEE